MLFRVKGKLRHGGILECGDAEMRRCRNEGISDCVMEDSED